MNRSTLSLALAGLATLPVALFGCGGGGSSSGTTMPSRIVYVSNYGTTGANKELFYADIPAGTTPSAQMIGTFIRKQLTADTAPLYVDEGISNSPANPNLVVFQSNRFTGPLARGLCIIDISAGPPYLAKSLTIPGGADQDTDPVWSADGTKIAFTRTTGGFTNIWTCDVGPAPAFTTSNFQQLTPNAAGVINKNPSWNSSTSSPLIAFASNRSGTFRIWTMDAVGAVSTTSLAGSPGDNVAPRWSPSGANIIFQGKPGTNWIVYTMDANGTNLTQRTDNSVDCQIPSYSPDGKYISYHQLSSGLRRLYSKPATDATLANGPEIGTAVLLSNDEQAFWGKS